MQHIHLKETDSTQTRVKEYLSQGLSNFLVSTDYQNTGVGRQGATWKCFPQALAFSFDARPNSVLTLTPLEVGVILAQFFDSELTLKWPNDLINPKKEKVGGILCQLVGKRVVIGVGINLKVPQEVPAFDYPVGGLLNQQSILADGYKKDLPRKLYKYFKNNRLSASEVREKFSYFCIHQNQPVTIVDGKKQERGRFVGLGENGEALLESPLGEMKSLLTGSLRFGNSLAQ